MLGWLIRLADGDLALRCCGVILHAQSDRCFGAEVMMAWKYGALGNRLQQAGFACTATSNNNDTRQPKVLHELCFQSAVLEVSVKMPIGAGLQLSSYGTCNKHF